MVWFGRCLVLVIPLYPFYLSFSSFLFLRVSFLSLSLGVRACVLDVFVFVLFIFSWFFVVF